MIPQTQTSTFETNITNIQHAFTIELTPTLAKLLSSQTYTDKVLAAIREPLSNAYDSHVRAGTLDQPVDLHLPTPLEPQFTLRDYGTGLSHDDVLKYFFSYGVSDKRETNNEIGGLGIGAKSFFAYVDQATITSYYNGIKRIYSANKGSNGLPQGMLVSVSETDEPNGIALSYPVQPHNISNFQSKTQDLLAHLPLKVNCNARLDIKPPVEFFSAEVRGAKVVLPTTNVGQLVVMGGIAYEIPADVYYGHAYARYQRAFNDHYIIYLPIGTVEISASRESLSPTDKDKDLIVDILNDFRQLVLEQDWTDRISKAETWIQAVKTRNYIQGITRSSLNTNNTLWKGMLTRGHFTLGGIAPVTLAHRNSCRSNRYGTATFGSDYVHRSIEKAYWFPKNKKIGWRKWYQENRQLGYGNNMPIDLHIHAETLTQAQDIVDTLGVKIEVEDGSFMKVAPKPRVRAKSSRPTGLAWINGERGRGSAQSLEGFNSGDLILSTDRCLVDTINLFANIGVLKSRPVLFWPYGMSNDIVTKRFKQYPTNLTEWCQRNKDQIDMNKWREHAVLHQLYMLCVDDYGRKRPSGWPKLDRIRENEELFGFPYALRSWPHRSEPLPLAKLPSPKRAIANVQCWVDKVYAKYPPTLQNQINDGHYHVPFTLLLELYKEMTAKK